MFDALKEGDLVAEEIVEEFGSYLGYALANVAVVTDPEVIVIGGGVSRAGEILLRYIEKYSGRRPSLPTRIFLSRLRSWEMTRGSAEPRN